MSPEPPPGSRQDGQDDGPERRPLSRGDLFGPQGSLGPGRPTPPAADEPRERSPWEPPADGPRWPEQAPGGPPQEQPTQAFPPGGEAPTEAYRPGQYQPRPPGEYAPGPYEPGQYQPGYGPGAPGAAPRGSAPQGGIPQGGHPGYGQGYEGGYVQGYGQEGYGFPPGTPPQRDQWYGDEPPPGRGGRGRNVVLGALLVLAVALVAGGVAYALVGGDGDDGRGAAAAPTVSATPPPAESSEPAQEASETPTPDPTDPADYDDLPSQPWRDGDLDFGYLVSVRTSGDEIQLEVNRATFLTGAEAAEANGGEAPENDYLIQDTNPKLRTFVLDPRAPIEGTTRLGEGGSNRQRLTAEEFAEKADSELGGGGDDKGIPIWMRHAGGEEDGTVTALAEQFVP